MNINNITVLSDSGLGYGHGKISAKNINAELKARMLNFLMIDSTAFIATVEGDGCGDGRMCYDDIDIAKPARAKMFGCGLMMHVAIQLAKGNVAKNANEQLEASLKELIAKSKESDFCFGAHTDDGDNPSKCGCGAMDNYLAILDSSQIYIDQIKESMKALVGSDFDDETYEHVSQEFKKALQSYNGDFSSTKISNEIVKDGADVRKLKGEHKEIDVVINLVSKSTLNQKAYFTHSNETVQAFSVDMWRIKQYADIFGNSKKNAIYGMLFYTLATAATLTDGSLRVLLRNP